MSEKELNLREGLPVSPNPDAAVRETVGKGKYTLLGPHPPIPPRQSNVNDHIDPALRSDSGRTVGTDGEIVEHAGSSNHPLNRSFKPITGSRIPPRGGWAR